jgi:hypothetical protein
MNWTAWNSVRANALENRPRVLPRTAFPTASMAISHGGPAVSRPSRRNATSETSVACTAAASANAAP